MTQLRKPLSLIMLAILLLASLFVFVPAALAASIVVTTTNDILDAASGICSAITISNLTSSPGVDGEISLREAICAANHTSGIDVISLPAGIYTLNLSNPDVSPADSYPDAEFNNMTGSLDINDDAKLGLTIQGAGAENTIIEACGGTGCTGIDRVFYIEQLNHVVFADLTIRNGYIDPNGDIGNLGGGIFNYLGYVELNNVILQNNFVNDSPNFGGGGGIANFGTMVIRNSTITGNSAYLGGGIYTEPFGVARIYNSTISGNNAAVLAGGIALVSTSCFTADTQILMADNTYKSIADVKAGDKVISFDFATNRRIISTVAKTSEHAAFDYLRVNGLGVTIEHPFSLGENQWIKAGDLKVGDQVFGNRMIRIRSVEHIQKLTQVYNLEVEGSHNYFVGNANEEYLVHNKFILSNTASPLDVYFSTIANNTVSSPSGLGGGVAAAEAIRLFDTILADNISAGTDPDCVGYVESSGFNLIEDGSSPNCIFNADVTDITDVDPRLGTLADNGGSTPTQSLLPGSPAIDTGSNADCASVYFTDQRAESRLEDGDYNGTASCDIGAYEYDPTPIVLSVVRADQNPTAASSVNFVVTFSENVTGVGMDDFVLTATGGASTGASVTNISSDSGATRTVTVSTGTGGGTIRLDLVDDDSIIDNVSQPLGGITAGNDNFNSGEVYTIYPILSVAYGSIGLNDGWLLETTETSNTGGLTDSTSTTFRVGDDMLDRQYRTILHFNTSSLPDNATITSITLKIKKQGVVGTNPFTTHGALLVDIRKPSFGTALLVSGDFQAGANKSAAASFSPAAISNWYSAINFTNASFPYINLTGTTQLRLRFSQDDNGDNNADYIKFFSGDYSTASARPQLIIQYYIP